MMDPLVRMQEQLTCPVCLEMYKAPKVLACNHSFCKTCLDSISKSNSTTCPICRTATKLPSGGAGFLPPDTFKMNLLEAYGQVNILHKGDKGYVCELCDEGGPDAAESRCLECSRFLCHDHTITHTKGRNTKAHRVVVLAHVTGDANPPPLPLPQQQQSVGAIPPNLCKEHNMKEFTLYCDFCDKLVCKECTAAHSSHRVVGLESAETKLKESLAQLIQQGKKAIFDYENGIQTSSKAVSAADAKSQSIKAEINRVFDTLQSILEQRKKFLLKEVESKAQQRVSGYNTYLQAMDGAATDLKTTCEYGERALAATGNAQELFQLKNSLQKRFDKNESKELPELGATLTFTFADFSSLCDLASNLGRISVSNTHAPLCVANGIGLARISKNAQSSFTITARDKYSQPILEGGELFTVGVVYPNGEIGNGEVEDLRNGTYIARYSTKWEGLHKISITLNGEHIEGSPFNVLCAKAKELTFDNGEVFAAKPHGSNGWNCAIFTSVGWKIGKQYIELSIDHISEDRGGIVIAMAPKDTAPKDFKMWFGIAMNGVAYNMRSIGFIQNEKFNNDNRVGIILDLDGDGNVNILYRRAQWAATGIKKNLASWQNFYVGVFLNYRNDRVSIVQEARNPAIGG